MVKIICPDGEERHIDDIYDAEYEHFPPVVIRALIAGRGKKKKRDPSKKPRFGVTRLTGPCLRRSYYDLVEEVPISLNKLWIFSRGHAIHNFFQEQLDESENEIFLSQDFGLFDAIGYVDVLSDNIMYEFKTIQSIPDKPKLEHTMQIQSYYSMLDPEQQANIKKLSIVYFSLNKIKQYEVPKINTLNWTPAQARPLPDPAAPDPPPVSSQARLLPAPSSFLRCFAA